MEFRGIFSPKSPESPDWLHIRAGELGAEAEERLLLLAPPDAPLQKGGRIVRAGREYAVLTADDYQLADQMLYRRAVLERLAN